MQINLRYMVYLLLKISNRYWRSELVILRLSPNSYGLTIIFYQRNYLGKIISYYTIKRTIYIKDKNTKAQSK